MTGLYYDFHVFCCTNRRPAGHEIGCCASKDSERLANYMKRKAKEMGIGAVAVATAGTAGAAPSRPTNIRINQSGCLGRCDLGPVLVIYPQSVWYSPKNEADIDEILTRHLCQGQIVDRLRLPPR